MARGGLKGTEKEVRLVDPKLDRRSFLRLTEGAAALAVASPLLRSADLAPFARRAPLQTIAYQLSWIKNFQFVGEYIADYKGYYRDYGLKVNLLAGGPNISFDAVVQSGKALIGQSTPPFTATAVNQGADLTIIGANYQKNPFCIISTKAKIKTPKELIGKRIGIQATNESGWLSFLKLNNIKPSQIIQVPVQYDISVLTSGSVDGFWGYVNDDVVNLQLKHIPCTVLLMADFGYTMVGATYMVRTSSLSNSAERQQIVQFLKGDIKGWRDAIADPALGARLTVDTYGKGLGFNVATELASCKATNPLMVDADTAAHGLMWMTPKLIEESVHTLATSGIKAKTSLFTDEILKEVYEEIGTIH